jgi:hypothetical protein
VPVPTEKVDLGQEPLPRSFQVDRMSPVDPGPVQGIGGQTQEDFAGERVVRRMQRRQLAEDLSGHARKFLGGSYAAC